MMKDTIYDSNEIPTTFIAINLKRKEEAIAVLNFN